MTSKTVASSIEVRSIDLLKFLANRGLVSKLEKISAEPVNGTHLPIFMFRPCFKVKEAITAYGKPDDRMNDKEMWWIEYDDSYFTAPLDKKTINSANYSAVERLINEGFGSYLVDIQYRVNSKDSVKSHRKVYRFMENDRIREIKAEEDAKSHARWQERKEQGAEAAKAEPKEGLGLTTMTQEQIAARIGTTPEKLKEFLDSVRSGEFANMAHEQMMKPINDMIKNEIDFLNQLKVN